MLRHFLYLDSQAVDQYLAQLEGSLLEDLGKRTSGKRGGKLGGTYRGIGAELSGSKEVEISEKREIPAARTGLKYEEDGREIPMNSLTASQLFELLARPSSSVLMRQSLMSYIIARPRQDMLHACIITLEESDSLPAAAAACGILQRLLGKRAEFLDFGAWRKACQSEIRGE